MLSFAKAIFVLWAVMSKAVHCDCGEGDVDTNVALDALTGVAISTTVQGKCKNNLAIVVNVACAGTSLTYKNSADTADLVPTSGCPCNVTQLLHGNVVLNASPATIDQLDVVGGTCKEDTSIKLKATCSGEGKGLLYTETIGDAAFDADAKCGNDAAIRKGSLFFSKLGA